ncbi:MAG: GntR family transcriptional regulator [Eubacteriales bacterium]|nr:GntR family transcriptional regulator [Eubacteriales bacterium]
MGSIRSTSLADQVFDRLEDDIIQGRYPRGEMLTELRLAQELGVSRTPIREALRQLEQERLIESVGKGSRVLGITQEDLVDIMTIRERVESLSTYYAVQNMTMEGLKEVADIVDLQDFYFSRRDAAHLHLVDDRFHDAICHLCGRPVLIDTLMPLLRKTRRYRKISLEDWDRTTQTKQEHFEIYQAIASADAELAEQRMRQHIANAKAHMMKGRDENA